MPMTYSCFLKQNLGSCVLSRAAVFLVFLLMPVMLLALDKPKGGFREAFGLDPEKQVSKSVSVFQLATSEPANVFHPGDKIVFTYRFTNHSGKPINAQGYFEYIVYRHHTVNPLSWWGTAFEKTGNLDPIPFSVNLPAKGSVEVKVSVPTPPRFGGFVLVADLGSQGRQFGSAFVFTPAPPAGKTQYPCFQLDLYGITPTVFDLWQRTGIRATRLQATPAYSENAPGLFEKSIEELGKRLEKFANHDVTVMLYLDTQHLPQPTGGMRRWLNEKGETVSRPKGDYASLPKYDPIFQKWCQEVTVRYGWPKGPVNAMELWNEPWEMSSISGWGADSLRYRELYESMARGIEAGRKQAGTEVLIGGTGSSMNTDDKLFPDGSDKFIKWLDFSSVHYQVMTAIPPLQPELMNRKSPYGPTRVWDTESWVANSEERVSMAVASMRAQGMSRNACVIHNNVFDVDGKRPSKKEPITENALHPWSLAAAIAATQTYLGDRAFHEIIFTNGLPWVFSFHGLPKADSSANPDDGVLVVVGDTGELYQRNRLLFRSVTGLANVPKIAAAEKAVATQPAAGTKEYNKLVAQVAIAHRLEGCSMTLNDGGGKFKLYDYFGNPLLAVNGKHTVPLNGTGYFLRTDGSSGSFEQLVYAVKTSRINGYEPVEIKARDFLGRIESKPKLRLFITNILNRPVTGRLTVSVGKLQLAVPPEPITISGDTTKEIDIPVVDGVSSAANTYPLSATYDAGVDGKKRWNEDLHVNVISHKTINVEGDLKDWKDVLPQTVSSAEVMTANETEKAWLPFMPFAEGTAVGTGSGFLAYDDKYFYFAAKIADDTPDEGGIRFANRKDDDYFWPIKAYNVTYDQSGKERLRREVTWPEGVRHFSYRRSSPLPSGTGHDNVLIAFGVFQPGENGMLACPAGTMRGFTNYKCTDYEYAFNKVAQVNGGGTEIWRLMAPGMPRKHFFPRQPKAPVDGGPVEDGKLVMKHEGKLRLVEAALPWSEIPDVKKRLDAGQTIRFSFHINNNTGPALELAAGRSVSQSTFTTFHEYWADHWSNELEFAFDDVLPKSSFTSGY